MATKKGKTTNFSSLLFFVYVGSGMEKNQDLESGINIPDPQHCIYYNLNTQKPVTIKGTMERQVSHNTLLKETNFTH
jgi:hypothetical protein